MKKKTKFHCKSKAQKKAIAANYARIAAQKKSSATTSKSQENFKLPLKNGGRR